MACSPTFDAGETFKRKAGFRRKKLGHWTMSLTQQFLLLSLFPSLQRNEKPPQSYAPAMVYHVTTDKSDWPNHCGLETPERILSSKQVDFPRHFETLMKI